LDRVFFFHEAFQKQDRKGIKENCKQIANDHLTNIIRTKGVKSDIKVIAVLILDNLKSLGAIEDCIRKS